MPSKQPRTLQQMANSTANIEGGGKGIRCQNCGCRDTRVETTRRHDNMVVRYRVCRNCHARRTTTET